VRPWDRLIQFNESFASIIPPESRPMYNSTLAKLKALQFDERRRLFLTRKRREGYCQLLLDALLFADRTDNHHLQYWLVREHAGNLRVPRGDRK
jgi:hypothetical protein